jgi:hypothetical protein
MEEQSFGVQKAAIVISQCWQHDYCHLRADVLIIIAPELCLSPNITELLFRFKTEKFVISFFLTGSTIVSNSISYLKMIPLIDIIGSFSIASSAYALLIV